MPVDTLVKCDIALCKWCGYTDFKILLVHDRFSRRLFVVECGQCDNALIPVVCFGEAPYKQCLEAWNEENT